MKARTLDAISGNFVGDAYHAIEISVVRLLRFDVLLQ